MSQAGSRIVTGLSVLAVLQIGILALSGAGPVSGAESGLLAGTDLSSLESTDLSGTQRPLVSGEPLLVLVFHSECAYCRVVAPEWAEWLRTRPSELEVVAVSREAVGDARAYAREHDWAVDVRSVPADGLGSLSHALTRRTPWVVALDGDGRIVTSGHGGEVAEVAAALLETDRR